MLFLKIGDFYEDKITGELFMCDNFTRSKYCLINIKGEYIIEEKNKADVYINGCACTDKDKIKKFLGNLKYNVKGLCFTCNKIYFSEFVRYDNERACGEVICPVCGDKLRY